MEKKRDSVIEQVMDDLCQEMQSSIDVSSSDIVEVNEFLKPRDQEEDVDIDSLIHFKPRKAPAEPEIKPQKSFVSKKSPKKKEEKNKDLKKVKRPVSKKEITALAINRTLSKLNRNKKGGLRCTSWW